MNEKFQKFIKLYLLIVSIFISACGIGLIVITLVWLKLEDYIPNDNFIDYVKYFKYALYAIGSWIFLIGLNGFLSVWKQNRCVLLIFQIQITFYAIIFLAIGIGIIFFLKKKTDDINCSNLDIMDDADLAIQKSSNLLCTDLCPCKCENAEVLAYLVTRNAVNAAAIGTSQDLLLNNLIQFKFFKRTVVSPSGAVRAQDCQNFEAVVGTGYDQIVDVLGFVEEKYSCSGLCSVNSIYLFSNLNNGIPQNKCLEKIIDEMKKFINIMGSVGLSVGIILFVTVIAACFLCCKHKHHDNKVSDDYSNVNQKNETNLHDQKIEDTF